MTRLKHVEIAEDNCAVAINIANQNEKYDLSYAIAYEEDEKEVMAFWNQVREAITLSTLSNEELLCQKDEITLSRMFLFFDGDVAIGYGGYYQLNGLMYINYWGTALGEGSFDVQVSIIEKIIQIIDNEEDDDVVHIQIDKRFEGEKIAHFIFPNLTHTPTDSEYILTGSRKVE